MVSTRLTSPATLPGLTTTDRRNRVDPVKLLALIQRIRTASGATSPAQARPKPNAAAKAG